MFFDFIVENSPDLHNLALKINAKERLGYRVLDMWKQEQDYYVKMAKGLIIFNVGPFSTKT